MCLGETLCILSGGCPTTLGEDPHASAMLRMATDGSRTLDSGLRDPKSCCEGSFPDLGARTLGRKISFELV